jgi:GWxTD domain-containing protein
VLDPLGAYRQAGLVVQGPPLGFVGSVRYLEGRTRDSTLVLVTLSLANRSLTFTGDGSLQRASYGIILELQQGAATVQRSETHQTVRVSSVRETTRGDESIIFQQFLAVAPGAYTLTITARDDGGANAGQQQIPLVVPQLAAGALSSPVVVYEATPRTHTDSAPTLIANPRATVTLGRDSLAAVYLEGYDLAPEARVVLDVRNERDHSVLHDTVTLARHATLSSAVLYLPVPRLGTGRFTVAASLVGSAQRTQTPLLVSLGEQLGIVSFDELVSYLRFYAVPERLAALRDTNPERRAAAWAAFWKQTDPVPATPEHEGLQAYFARIQTANTRFREEGGAGWLSDRGKVFVSLGEPDRILEQQGTAVGTRGRAQAWEYSRENAQLIFIDQSGFGRWRLTTTSEAQYLQMARRAMVQ